MPYPTLTESNISEETANRYPIIFDASRFKHALDYVMKASAEGYGRYRLNCPIIIVPEDFDGYLILQATDGRRVNSVRIHGVLHTDKPKAGRYIIQHDAKALKALRVKNWKPTLAFNVANETACIYPHWHYKNPHHSNPTMAQPLARVEEGHATNYPTFEQLEQVNCLMDENGTSHGKWEDLPNKITIQEFDCKDWAVGLTALSNIIQDQDSNGVRFDTCGTLAEKGMVTAIYNTGGSPKEPTVHLKARMTCFVNKSATLKTDDKDGTGTHHIGIDPKYLQSAIVNLDNPLLYWIDADNCLFIRGKFRGMEVNSLITPMDV